MSATGPVFDVDEQGFADRVVERSATVPVVVDFWAEWCGPCRTLGPMLEQAVSARDGRVELAKVDVDREPQLAQRHGVQGIPTVVGYRDGQVLARFSGAVPATQIETFLDDLMPTAADEAVARARTLPAEQAERELRSALELDPDHREAAVGLAELRLADAPDEALELVRPHRPDPAAEAIATRAELAADAGVDLEELRARAQRAPADADAALALGRALAAEGDYGEAIDALLTAVELGGDAREPAREQLVALFNLLGDDDQRVRAGRPRLASALF